MGCAECEYAQSRGTSLYYYRWGVANILIVGCPLHVKQVMDALNGVQSGKREG